MAAQKKSRHVLFGTCFLASIALSVVIVLAAPVGDGSSCHQFLDKAPAPQFERAGTVANPLDPTKDLEVMLPPPGPAAGVPYLGDELSEVPEVAFDTLPARPQSGSDSERLAWLATAGHYLNAREEDGYVKTLLRGRSDLAGLPFRMGNDCRINATQALELVGAVSQVRMVERWAQRRSSLRDDELTREVFRDGFARFIQRTKAPAYVAAVRQIMEGVDVNGRLEVVKSLSGVQGEASTEELARLAVYPQEETLRETAIKALPIRKGVSTADVLAKALRYPWPPITQRAADAVIALRRTDLLPNVVALLEEADPRAPNPATVAGERVAVAREVVRVNHLKNCLLCHAPVKNQPSTDPRAIVESGDSPLASVPLPSQPLPPVERGYDRRPSLSGILVRIDITYLRQDFSVMQRVENAHPWPDVQRFDFFVRERRLSPAEADELRKALKRRGPSPYHAAAVKTLRTLTGRDFGTDAAAWRRHLRLPARSGDRS